MQKFSQRDSENIIYRLRSLQNIHGDLLDKLFNELSIKLENKEISNTFWDSIPSDLRHKYMEPVKKIREEIREIIEKYPEYFQEYRKKNIPYFSKRTVKPDNTIKMIPENKEEEIQLTV